MAIPYDLEYGNISNGVFRPFVYEGNINPQYPEILVAKTYAIQCRRGSYTEMHRQNFILSSTNIHLLYFVKIISRRSKYTQLTLDRYLYSCLNFPHRRLASPILRYPKRALCDTRDEIIQYWFRRFSSPCVRRALLGNIKLLPHSTSQKNRLK